MADYKNPDYWQLKARQEGYPARSVYKLDEMNRKFGLLNNPKTGKTMPNLRVLDLGAAPGSWSLYVLRKIKLQGMLVSVDLSPLSREFDKGLFDQSNFHFIQGDITAETVKQDIFSRAQYSLLLSDAAPATTGNRTVDTQRSLELAEAVLVYAQTALIRGANMCVKVFQGGDTASVLKRIKELFSEGKSFKPEACRSESFETYYVGLGFKGSGVRGFRG